MEKVHEFQQWLDQTVRDARTKLGLSDETLAYILLKTALDCHLRALAQERLKAK